MKILFLTIAALFLVSCEKETTKNRAMDMFREPSSEEQGKIPDKFQPIDHEIEKAEPEDK